MITNAISDLFYIKNRTEYVGLTNAGISLSELLLQSSLFLARKKRKSKEKVRERNELTKSEETVTFCIVPHRSLLFCCSQFSVWYMYKEFNANPS